MRALSVCPYNDRANHWHFHPGLENVHDRDFGRNHWCIFVWLRFNCLGQIQGADHVAQFLAGGNVAHRHRDWTALFDV